jgi:hypothetical protein
VIFVILPFIIISGLLNIILLGIVVKHCKENQKTKIQGEYTWFDVYYITTHWYNNCYAFTQQVFIFWLLDPLFRLKTVRATQNMSA